MAQVICNKMGKRKRLRLFSKKDSTNMLSNEPAYDEIHPLTMQTPFCDYVT